MSIGNLKITKEGGIEIHVDPSKKVPLTEEQIKQKVTEAYKESGLRDTIKEDVRKSAQEQLIIQGQEDLINSEHIKKQIEEQTQDHFQAAIDKLTQSISIAQLQCMEDLGELHEVYKKYNEVTKIITKEIENKATFINICLSDIFRTLYNEIGSVQRDTDKSIRKYATDIAQHTDAVKQKAQEAINDISKQVAPEVLKKVVDICKPFLDLSKFV